MGYADGYYYGQGRIICDTSTFSVGDTIRVRSMTDSSKVWNQQVATVGTALVFTVPCYDYYKICTVQDIGGTPTEIGGVYKTVDYGQTLFINVLDTDSLTGIKGIINAHQENQFFNVGDIKTIKVGGSDVEIQIFAIDLYSSHEIIFGCKNIWTQSQWNSSAIAIAYEDSVIRSVVQSFYTQMEEADKACLDLMTRNQLNVWSATSPQYNEYQDKVWLPNLSEVFADYPPNPPQPRIQFPIFSTQANRIRQYEGVNAAWWLTDNGGSTAAYMSYVQTNGNWTSDVKSATLGILPCFRIKADS